MAIAEWSMAIVAAYLAGAIPFALLLGRLKGVDLRKEGSQNIGATNCGRVLGRRWGVVCFLLDVAKGSVPVVAVGWWFGLFTGPPPAPALWGWLATAGAAMIGHVHPVWLGFRGGKGVATGFGVILALWPYLTYPGLCAGGVWLLLTALFRYVSLSSVVAAVALPISLLVAFQLSPHWDPADLWPLVLMTGLMAAIVVVRHQSNLRRLLRGEEERIGE